LGAGRTAEGLDGSFGSERGLVITYHWILDINESWDLGEYGLIANGNVWIYISTVSN